MHITHKEEDYLKRIAQLSNWGEKYVSTNELSSSMKMSPPAITDMLKRMFLKGIVLYKKYQGVKLSKKGNFFAKDIIRRQRLWQFFLVDKLKIELNDVINISEELKHINFEVLITRLDDYLGNPIYSPFGESIPNKDGELIENTPTPLYLINEGSNVIVTAMKENNNPNLIQYFYKKGIYIGAKINLIEKLTFDDSIDISIDNKQKVNISRSVAENILVNSK
ncbi:MAG: metal-dependent transcriptional regulator [Bacteroidetes bacterium]|nr:metal-dependent transcriptional regulator [Bacteroidota bacterium]